jgi:hypothetical protein
MAGFNLLNDDISASRRLVALLEESGEDVLLAFLERDAESARWRLVLAPRSKRSTQYMADKIGSLTTRPDFPFSRIRAGVRFASADDADVTVLLGRVSAQPGEMVHIGDEIIGDRVIEEAVVIHPAPSAVAA